MDCIFFCIKSAIFVLATTFMQVVFTVKLEGIREWRMPHTKCVLRYCKS